MTQNTATQNCNHEWIYSRIEPTRVRQQMNANYHDNGWNNRRTCPKCQLVQIKVWNNADPKVAPKG